MKFIRRNNGTLMTTLYIPIHLSKDDLRLWIRKMLQHSGRCSIKELRSLLAICIEIGIDDLFMNFEENPEISADKVESKLNRMLGLTRKKK